MRHKRQQVKIVASFSISMLPSNEEILAIEQYLGQEMKWVFASEFVGTSSVNDVIGPTSKRR